MLDRIYVLSDYVPDEDLCPCCGERLEYQLCGTCEALWSAAWDGDVPPTHAAETDAA